MHKEVAEYFPNVLPQQKNPVKPPQGLLEQLLAPQGPWSDISLDSVDHPSQEVTTILTIVDKFSKMVNFVLLLKLPSTKETEVVLHSVFCLHDFPRDILSDRGLQIVAQFWREFYSLARASVSLSFGYHPQTNSR